MHNQLPGAPELGGARPVARVVKVSRQATGQRPDDARFALEDALLRERALRIVIEALIANLRPSGLRRRRFREDLERAELGCFGDVPPKRMRDALHLEAQRAFQRLR